MTKFVPGIIAAALASVLLLQWMNWPPPPSTAGLADTPAKTPADEGGSTEDAAARLKPPGERESYANVLERPIFRPDRRPAPPDDLPGDATPASDKTALEGMDLTGVLITPALASAWVKDPDKPKLQRLRIGDDFVGWQVREIRDDRVLLERQGETYPLILRDYTKKPPDKNPPAPVSRRPDRKADSSNKRPVERHRPAESRPNAPRSQP